MTASAPETVVTTEDASTAGEDTKIETPAVETGTDTGEDTDAKDTNSIDSLPDWAQDEIKGLRSESAARRRQLRDAEEKLKTAKTPEEFETAVNEWRGKAETLERANIAQKAGLPESFADRLRGNTAEELAADAKTFADLMRGNTAESGEPNGGLDPDGNDGEESWDPIKIANSLPHRRF